MTAINIRTDVRMQSCNTLAASAHALALLMSPELAQHPSIVASSPAHGVLTTAEIYRQYTKPIDTFPNSYLSAAALVDFVFS